MIVGNSHGIKSCKPAWRIQEYNYRVCAIYTLLLGLKTSHCKQIIQTRSWLLRWLKTVLKNIWQVIFIFFLVMKFFYRIDEIFYYIFFISRLGFTQLVLIRFTSRQAIGGRNQCICACLFVSKYFDVVSFVLLFNWCDANLAIMISAQS